MWALLPMTPAFLWEGETPRSEKGPGAGLGMCARTLTHGPWLVRSPGGRGPAGCTKSLSDRPRGASRTRCPNRGGGGASIVAGETPLPCSPAARGLSEPCVAAVLALDVLHQAADPFPPLNLFHSAWSWMPIWGGGRALGGESPGRGAGQCTDSSPPPSVCDLGGLWRGRAGRVPDSALSTPSSKEHRVFQQIQPLGLPSSTHVAWRWSVRSDPRAAHGGKTGVAGGGGRGWWPSVQPPPGLLK